MLLTESFIGRVVAQISPEDLIGHLHALQLVDLEPVTGVEVVTAISLPLAERQSVGTDAGRFNLWRGLLET